MNPAALLNATVSGQGPHTVVFGNGFATTQRAWDTIVAQMPADWRIVRFDFVGTTPATTPFWITERYATYEGHADDLVRLLAFLDVRNALLVGHSMSGMVSALASRRAPERLSHLLMVGASACYTDHERYHGGFSQDSINELLRVVDADMAAWMAGFSPSLMGDDASDHQLHEYMDTLLAMRPDIGRTMLHSIFRSDYRPLLSMLMVPTTVVQTAHDVAVPLAAAEYLARHTACTGLHVLPVSGHLPHVTHPQLLLPIILDTMRTHAASATTADHPDRHP